MVFEDWNKAGKIYEKIRKQLNDGELVTVVKSIFNNLEEKYRLQLLTILKNTGFLEPFAKKDS